MSTPPPFPQGSPAGQPAGTFTCPKCRGTMRTYDRNGIHVEQCTQCRGVFLDFGELDALIRLESSAYAAPPPPMPQQGHYGPDWGHHGGKHYRKRGFGGLFFSS